MKKKEKSTEQESVKTWNKGFVLTKGMVQR